MREKILSLRQQGKTYTEIMKELGCSSSTIAYHLDPEQNKKTKQRNVKYDAAKMALAVRRRKDLIVSMGGCCSLCGYNKNFAAIDFHHIESEKKDFNITTANIRYSGLDRIKKEAKKCILLCANCHRELHNPDKIMGT